MKSRPLAAAIAGFLVLSLSTACSTAPSPPPDAAPQTPEATTTTAAPAPAAVPAPAHAASTAPEPERIKLQHILISFTGKVPGKNITRSEAEARALAARLLERARGGEDFDALVKQYTDDRHPGIYSLSNRGVAAAQGEFRRERMVPAFGDVGFTLQPGETGMAPYDPSKSPYGWHIIRRLE
ncbi:MAG: peptidylprolyl isomerase [Thermoanaerobaculia bacterium]